MSSTNPQLVGDNNVSSWVPHALVMQAKQDQPPQLLSPRKVKKVGADLPMENATWGCYPNAAALDGLIQWLNSKGACSANGNVARMYMHKMAEAVCRCKCFAASSKGYAFWDMPSTSFHGEGHVMACCW